MIILEADRQSGQADQRSLLARAQPLHSQLRPRIPPPYADYLIGMFAEGAHLAVLFAEDRPRALSVWRCYSNTYHGRHLFVDDLVAEESERGQGWGGRLLEFLEQRARALGCDNFVLDSGVQRERAHRFYFRAGFTIRSYHFVKPLTERF